MIRRRGRTSRQLIALTMLSFVLLGACTFGGEPGRDPVEYFDDPAAQELARVVLQQDTDEISALTTAGTSPDVSGKNGLLMLEWAIWNNKPDSTIALLKAGSDPNAIGDGGNTPMHLAAFSSNTAHLSALLEHGGDPNVPGEITGSTPLDRALLNNIPEPYQMLLEAGADPNAADKNGDTPMHTAARTNKGVALLAMLERGGDPYGELTRGTTWQDFYWDFNGRAAALNDRAKEERRALIAWFDTHGHELHPDAEQFRTEADR